MLEAFSTNCSKAGLCALAIIHSELAIGDGVRDNEWGKAGKIGVESRYFSSEPQFARQDNNQPWSVFFQPEVNWRNGSGSHQVHVEPFYRYDTVDENRSHVDIREAYWRISSDSDSLLVGVQQVFWGVAESRHLVDVVNQTDLVEGIDQEVKLGQPMVQVTRQTSWGEFSGFWLPFFRERTFPGNRGRFGFDLPVSGDARYTHSAERQHSDLALRYTHYLGDWDIGAHLFRGTSREPVFTLFQGELVPLYAQMKQLGLDLQYTRDAWLLKGELVARETQGDSFTAAVVGLEYTHFGLLGSDADLGLLTEYLYDDREDFHPVTPFDDDIFMGARLTLNDVADSSALFGFIHDPDTSETFVSLEASSRLGRSFRLELDARWITGADQSEALNVYKYDDYLQLSIVYHF